MDAIDSIPGLRNRGAAARQDLLGSQIRARSEAFETGVDPEFLAAWTWPHDGLWKQAARKVGGV